MFVGHAAVALAAKSKAQDVSLGWLLAAAFGLDLLWPNFLLLGIEHVEIVPGATAFTPFVFESYPWSHSLVMACLWGLCAAGIARWRGRTAGVAFLIAAIVVSHWVLDVASHAPDMPLWPGDSPKLGLGLWNSIPATLVVEGAIYLIGITVYVRCTRAQDRIGSIGLWAFLIACALMWVAGPWTTPPPSARALAWFAQAAWLLILWAWWIDRHRVPRAQTISSQRS
jgi:hypothetical protein